jgi:hypothetical protein
MPRYFFDIVEEGFAMRDEEGSEMSGLEAAEVEAITTAASIGKDIFPKIRRTSGVLVRVRDEHALAFEVEVCLRTKRH